MSKSAQQVRAEEFVRVWQTARTCNDVATHYGVTVQAVNLRASRLRARGVPLKKHSPVGRHRLGVRSLATLARKLNKAGASRPSGRETGDG